jgi:YD repeat-containing protein
MTSFNGSAMTYDAIGNPLTDGKYTYTWEAGRQLSSLTANGQTAAFKYNDQGIRTEKTVNGITYKYYLVGGQSNSGNQWNFYRILHL